MTTVSSSHKVEPKKSVAQGGVDFKLGANGQYAAVERSPRHSDADGEGKRLNRRGSRERGGRALVNTGKYSIGFALGMCF